MYNTPSAAPPRRAGAAAAAAQPVNVYEYVYEFMWCLCVGGTWEPTTDARAAARMAAGGAADFLDETGHHRGRMAGPVLLA